MTPVYSLFSRRRIALGLLVMFIVGGCDDDPTGLAATGPVATALGDPIITRQGDIRVQFAGAVDPASALDPANFVVINSCSGLRVPGALRLEGNVLIFTPSTILPYLTPLSIRVQNVQTVQGVGMNQPFTFVRTTEAPLVTDVSWSTLDSPTGNSIAGVDFVTRDLGYVVSLSAELYRTENGGSIFEAVFKDPNVTGAKGVRAASRDTVYFIGAPNFGGTTFTTSGLFRSTNAGLTFDTLLTRSPADLRTLSRERVGDTDILFMGGNVSGALAGVRYDAKTGERTDFRATGIGTVIGNAGDISPDTANAILVGLIPQAPGVAGIIYESRNSGRSFTRVTANLPTPLRQLQGVGFIDNTTALLVGDSSTVIRYDLNAGTFTSITAGVPQTFNDPLTQTVETFTFRKADFSPTDRQIGWVIGQSLRRVPGVPDVRRGVILMTRDGGLTFTRQAVEGAGELGLGFPSLATPSDISALATDFVAAGGLNGFLAARTDDTQAAAGVCSFDTP